MPLARSKHAPLSHAIFHSPCYSATQSHADPAAPALPWPPQPGAAALSALSKLPAHKPQNSPHHTRAGPPADSSSQELMSAYELASPSLQF